MKYDKEELQTVEIGWFNSFIFSIDYDKVVRHLNSHFNFFWPKLQFYGAMPPMPKVHAPMLPMPKYYGRTLPTPIFDPCHPWTHAPTLPTPPMNLCYISHLHYLADSARIGNGNPKTTILRFVNLSPFNYRLPWKHREMRRASKI